MSELPEKYTVSQAFHLLSGDLDNTVRHLRTLSERVDEISKAIEVIKLPYVTGLIRKVEALADSCKSLAKSADALEKEPEEKT